MQDESHINIHNLKIITSRGTRMNKGMQRFMEKYFANEVHLHITKKIARISSRVIS